MVKAPARDPSDFCIEHSAEPALFVPEKTKRTSIPPETFPAYGFLRVARSRFHRQGRRVHVTFDFNVSTELQSTLPCSTSDGAREVPRARRVDV
jgi:hypothetical protein